MASAPALATTTTAEFSQARNDLYWSIYAGADGRIRWTGYDDGFWWDNISKSEFHRTRVGEETGRIFTIDFGSGEVTIAPAGSVPA